MESMCWKGLVGQEVRYCRANRGLRESRMLTARAIISRGREARVRRACTREVEAGVRDAGAGIRFVRWIAGPDGKILLVNGSRHKE